MQRIRGPVFLDCGWQDLVWRSCPYAQAIIDHLNAAHDHFSHVLYASSDAGHGVGAFIPYEPTENSLFPEDSLAADQQARAQNWPQLLNFLAALGDSS